MVALLEKMSDQWKALTALGGAVGFGVAVGMAAAIWSFTLGSLPRTVASNTEASQQNAMAVQANAQAIQYLARADTAIIKRLDQLVCIQVAQQVSSPVMSCLQN